MAPEQYLDAHPAEVFANIAEAMGYGWPDRVNFITNAEQRWELLEWYIETARTKITYGLHAGDTTVLTINLDFVSILGSDNPPRELVLVAMDMLGIGDETN